MNNVWYACILAASTLAAAGGAKPPVAKRVPHTQTWHGKAFSDDYFWMREKENPAVKAHLKAENAYTETMTHSLKPFQEALYQEMIGRIKQTDMDVPVLDNGYLYYARTVEGLQYAIHCRKKGTAEGAEEVILDPNELGKGLAFISVGAMTVSDDNRLLAYSTDTTGFRQYRLQVKDLGTGKLVGEGAERVTSMAWGTDGRTLYYTTEDPVTKRSNQVWRHPLGGKPTLLFEEKDETFAVNLSRTRDRAFLVLQSQSTDTWESRVLEAGRVEGDFRVVLPREKGHKYDVDHREGLFYIRTNREAKDFRIVTAPVADPSPAGWKPFVPAEPGVLIDGVDLFRDFILVSCQKEGLPEIRILDIGRQAWHAVTFPEKVYGAGIRHTPDYASQTFRFGYASMVTPQSVFEYTPATRTRTLLKQQEVLGGYDPSSYRTERVWATARDGVKVPISLVYRKDLKRDGKAPLFLYGYGSYGMGMPVGFSTSRLSLLNRGMVFAIAHIRGGNELGEGWHHDGMLMKKRNTFFDFIDCAEHLVREGWTSRSGLVAEGGSAGGLLIGAVVNERPELFRAVHAAVPFVDVMNTMMDASLPLTVGEYLEWGNPNEKAAFDYMLSYSPYDNLKKGAYPAMLVTTSFNDSQVMYWEPAKYVAKLRTLKTDKHPLLFRCKLENAGHGGASGRYDALRDKAFEYAWMLTQVGITK